jgi:putative DNA primase/helicase
MSVAAPNLDAAKSYAARGWHIFPLTRDTKGSFPDGRSSHLLKRGFRGASTDMGQIEAWWRQWPEANIGLNLVASGLIAIDADLYKPGCNWSAFVAGKDIPETFVQGSVHGRGVISPARSV